MYNEKADEYGKNRKLFGILLGRQSPNESELFTVCIKKEWVRRYKCDSNNDFEIYNGMPLGMFIPHTHWQDINRDNRISLDSIDHNLSSYCGFTIELTAQNTLLQLSKNILTEIKRNMDRIESVRSYPVKVIY